jgi:hypothetical protein
MSTVRMSMRLMDEIKQAAQKKFDRTNPKTPYPETLADEIYDDLLAGKLDKVSKVVEKELNGVVKFKTTDCKNLKMTSIKKDVHGEKNKETFSLMFTSSRTVPKFVVDSGWDPEVSVFVDNNYKAFKTCEKIKEDNRQLSTRRAEFLNNISDTLDKFTTLNQCLKAFPAIKDLVDHDYIEKVNKKDERKAKQEKLQQEVETNLSELKEVLLEDKLLGDD